MALTLDDPMVQVQLFRFIDALPALKDAGSVRRHLAEYLDEAGDARPLVAEPGAAAGARRHDAGRVAGRRGAAAAGTMARQFIAGATPDEAFRTVLSLAPAELGVHRRPAGRGGHQRGRGRRVPADLPGDDRRARRPAGRRPPRSP